MVSRLRRPTPEELEELRALAEYQFAVPGELLVPDGVLVEVSATTGKVRRIFLDGAVHLTLRASDYRFNIHLSAGRILDGAVPHPRLRVYVSSVARDFVAAGGNVFCKHVIAVDPLLRVGDEVLVADGRGELIAVGRLVKPAPEVVFYRRGEAVRVREGVRQQGQR
ncbi:MAG: PUA domain-containing protein [Desulfurococcaceae archaeon]